MNNKGHVGTVMLVFGALILVGVSLVTFLEFKTDVRLLDADFRGLTLETRDTRALIFNRVSFIISESIKLSKDSLDFENEFRRNLIELSQKERDSLKDVQNNVFAEIANGKFTLEKNGEDYVLSVKDLFFSLKTTNSVSSAEYKFDINSKFNKDSVSYVTLS